MTSVPGVFAAGDMRRAASPWSSGPSPKAATCPWHRPIPDGLYQTAMTTSEDIPYRLYVREKIERALQNVEEGRVVPEEEMERRMQRWLFA
jgi:hypothetical protein